MEIVKKAVAGTLESNDVLVSVSPNQEGISIKMESIVFDQFGPSILAAVQETVKAVGLTKGQIYLEDRGALDCTIRARVETALLRGMNP